MFEAEVKMTMPFWNSEIRLLKDSMRSEGTDVYWQSRTDDNCARSTLRILTWLMMEFKGLRISCEIVELIKLKKSPSAF